ncbi:SRPBCC family protein [Modestobacter roseus]|uniref:Polyketide cyclase/dehydrase/lipid transport protein n=1 Tax=Modestobacter roseus TaxID=1181884 RepID=A0A562IW36_9ACTN|nr:SRPBCC family protein [Modestobacter roseus]MQA36027.1 SRPBCC family protein [Modestobacter roseus]TWH75023.1 polyketide cyclase/dehydrase/lipid transport protein [Modestobacter roseus]
MTTLTLHATGPVDPAEVWDRYLHPDRWSEWSPQISRVTSSAPRIAPGVAGRVHDPLGTSVGFVVGEVSEAGRRWAWQVTVGPTRLDLLHWVRPGPDGGTTTGLRISGIAPLVVGYAPLALLALKRLVTVTT